MDLHQTSIAAFGIESSIQVLNDGFADYIVSVQLTPASFQNMVRTASLDLHASRVLVCDGNPAGVALIARRADESRLAAMSIKQDFRGRGSGRAFLNMLMDDARGRSDRRMVLEVIESNAPALRLYESAGFKPIRRLLSFEAQPDPVSDQPVAGELEHVTSADVALVVAADGYADLPWQVASETVALTAPPSVAVRQMDSFAVVSDPSASQIALQSLVTRQAARGKGQGASLVRSLFARYPGKRWIVPAIFPEEMGSFFKSIGFTPGSISQIQMGIDLG